MKINLETVQTRTENIYKVREGWIIDYPAFSKLADDQMHSFWPHDEPVVDDDIQDLRVNLTESERHGLVEVLKLFTLYEMRAGNDYWAKRIMPYFLRPEIQRMATMFSCVEMNSHAPFYNKINEVLYLDNEDFYSEWRDNEVLTQRMEFISDCVTSDDDLISIGAFTFIEGTILYSSFAFIKHFQSQECGKNLIKNIVSGINLSVNDENTHAVGGALLFRTIRQERNLSDKDNKLLDFTLRSIGRFSYEHEERIIDRIFEKGDISGITKANMCSFVKHRINLCLSELGVEPLYDEDKLDGYIKSWFYNSINSVNLQDFFTSLSSEYSINWKEDKFGSVWSKS